MPASPLRTRRRLLIALVMLALAVAAVVAVTVATLRSGADPAAGATTSASPTASSGEGAEPGSGETGRGGGDPADPTPSDGDPADGDGDGGDAEPGDEVDPAAPEARETLDPAPFGAEATPEPGVTVTVPEVEEVTGEANVPGEVGGPALRFSVELTNGTGETLDLRTVAVNAYYGPDRAPAAPLLKPGGRAFVPEVAAGDSATAAFVFSVPPELQDEVVLEIDPGVESPIVIFTGV